MADRYRVGSKLGRTIYQDDKLIGLVDTDELGALVVEALNARDRFLSAEARPLPIEERLPLRMPIDTSPEKTCGRVGMHNCIVTGRWQNHDTARDLCMSCGEDRYGSAPARCQQSSGHTVGPIRPEQP